MSYGLYIHVPYCRSRCRYCDFHTAGANRCVPNEFVQAVLRDYALYAPRKSDGNIQPPRTVYFGGGTPGLLTPRQVEEILCAVSPQSNAEITLETNPELAREKSLVGWRKAGVNRLSLGVQTANNQSLERLGRLHRAKDSVAALQAAQKAGFSNITGDIMLALPQYSKQEFDETLSVLRLGGVAHISAYLLKIEEGTAFAKKPPCGVPDADEAAEFYEYAVEELEKTGYHQYEVSNFCKPGHESKHNLLYWNCENYLGIGPAAHSCIDGRRFSFARDTEQFLNGGLPPTPEGECGAGDYIMLRLRLTAGLDENTLWRRYNAKLSGTQTDFLKNLEQQGFVQHHGSVWKLTKQGLLVQNYILTRLLE